MNTGVMNLRHRVGALCWTAVLLYFVAQPVVAAAWTGRYSWSRNYISDLGLVSCTPELCSPRHAVMNAIMVLTGGLVLVGVVLLWPSLTTRRLSAVGLVLVAIGGLGTATAGLFPADALPLVHGMAAATHIPLQAVGLLLLGLGNRRERPLFGRVTALFGVVAVVGTAVFFSGVLASTAVGAAERLADYPFYAGLVVAGLMLIFRRSADSGTVET